VVPAVIAFIDIMYRKGKEWSKSINQKNGSIRRNGNRKKYIMFLIFYLYSCQ